MGSSNFSKQHAHGRAAAAARLKEQASLHGAWIMAPAPLAARIQSVCKRILILARVVAKMRSRQGESQVRSRRSRRATTAIQATLALLASPAIFAEDLSWLYPINPAQAPAEDKGVVAVHLPNSRREFSTAQLSDLFFAPDWHPQAHGPMPDIVLHGRRPDTFACGYCHLPSGEGRPENAALAALPAAYIVRQVADIRSGARRSAWRGPSYKPIDLMREVAAHVTDADLAAAADYFSRQTLPPRLRVSEQDRIPRMQIAAWIYCRDPRGGDEALGRRLIEWAPELQRHEFRDPDMRYNVSVPRGSLRRGRHLALDGEQACSRCHGADLQGLGVIPALAGRSPTYLLRQLAAFKSQERAGDAAQPMQQLAAKLTLDDMIAVIAYAASR